MLNDFSAVGGTRTPTEVTLPEPEYSKPRADQGVTDNTVAQSGQSAVTPDVSAGNGTATNDARLTRLCLDLGAVIIQLGRIADELAALGPEARVGRMRVRDVPLVTARALVRSASDTAFSAYAQLTRGGAL